MTNYQNTLISRVIGFLLILLFLNVLTITSQSMGNSDLNIQTPQLTPTAINYNLLPVVENLLMDNGGCNLPCWWGFKVGEAQESDWVAFLEEQGLLTEQEIESDQDGRVDDTGGNLLYALGSWYADFNLIYSLENQSLNSLQISFVNPNEWLSKEITTVTLPGLFAQLEQTPSVYITTDSLGQWWINQLDIWVVSEENVLVASYTFDLRERQDKPELNYGDDLNLCLSLSETTRIALYLENTNDLEQVSGISSRILSNSRYHTSDEIFGIDNEAFVEFFQKNPDKCLEVAYLKPA